MSATRAVSTFSIVARDPESGDFGVATASKFLAVGAVVPYAKALVGAVATQSYADTRVGPRTIAALEQGIPLHLIHQAFAETDTDHAMRQYGLVDASGHSLSFTGEACQPWAGGREGAGYAAQGNLLTGPEVIERLCETYEAANAPFPERLLTALRAADQAGGDKRGRQSAALLVVRHQGGYGGFNDHFIDLRVDDHPNPVPELQRLLGIHRLYFEPPKDEDALTIEGEVEARLLAVLRASGAEGLSERWDERARQALRELAGVENLEERMFAGDRIDRVVLEYLERRLKLQD
jgi:uncharacterized Ntn-hydrolase superfamily protein